MAQQISTNTFGVAKWVVSADATQGTHTTIQAAINSAASGDTIYIRDGTYTENLTLKAGVNLTSFSSNLRDPNVIIKGNATFTGAGSVSIGGIGLQTNGAAFLTISGSAASLVDLIDCFLNCADATGIVYSSSSVNSGYRIRYCNGDIGAIGIGLFANSGAGVTSVIHSRFINSGGSSTASSTSGGSLTFEYTTMFSPLSTSSTGNVTLLYSEISTFTQNVAAVAITGSTTHSFIGSTFISGTASAITVGAGSTLILNNCNIYSANANNVTGAGSLIYNGNSFVNLGPGVSPGVNVTTLAPRQFGTTLINSQQPCFLAFLSTDQTNATGDGTIATVAFDTIVYDQGSNFTTGASAQFTAPYTGKYFFSTTAKMTPGVVGTNQFNVRLVATSRTLQSLVLQPGGAGIAAAPTVSGIIDMTAGDTLHVTAIGSNGTKSTNINGTASPYVTFLSGYLVC